MLKVLRLCIAPLRRAVDRRFYEHPKGGAAMAQISRFPSGRDEVLSIDNSNYLVPYSESDAIVDDGNDDFSLVTVFRVPDERGPYLTEKWVKEAVHEYMSTDDVFSESFLAGVIFHGASNVHVTDEARAYLQGLGNRWIEHISNADMLPGPYARIAGRLRDVWKLVDDSSGTCMTAVRPQNAVSDSFETLRLASSDHDSVSIALPSRIKARAKIDSPVAGWRIVIKDNIDLEGIKTSLGNRAYYEVYPPRSQTAENIQKVIDRGVVVVGKAKMNSFGNWEEATEYIDYHAPWNPRADGYQSTGGSSAGSAAAVAAYDWLDIAIGTDSWGSITRPALWCGCFGLRPSIGAVSTHGIEPYVPTWDMPGILGRDLPRFRQFAAEWIQNDAMIKDPKPFSAILWASDFWSDIEPAQIEIARKFVHDAEAYLGLPCVDVSFEEEWRLSPPAEAEGRSLPEYINSALVSLAYDIYHSEDDFRERYMNKFGQPPYTSPPNQRVWDMGKTLSEADRDSGFIKIGVYERWFNEIILKGDRSNALIVHPQENMAPRYRDQPPTFKRPPQDGICSIALAAVLRGPALAIPISQIAYSSTVSGKVEHLPFVVTLVSAQGTDLFLLQTAQEILESANRPTSVSTGKVMWKL